MWYPIKNFPSVVSSPLKCVFLPVKSDSLLGDAFLCSCTMSHGATSGVAEGQEVVAEVFGLRLCFLQLKES